MPDEIVLLEADASNPVHLAGLTILKVLSDAQMDLTQVNLLGMIWAAAKLTRIGGTGLDSLLYTVMQAYGGSSFGVSKN